MGVAEITAIALIVLALGVTYGLPTAIAFFRTHPHRWLILVANMVFGATIIGWIGALIWALVGRYRDDGKGGRVWEIGVTVPAITVNQGPSVRPEAAPTARTADPIEDLAKLKRLLDEGAISVDEYARLKAPILDRL